MTKPKFELSRVSGTPVSDAELLADLRRVASVSGNPAVSQKKYGELGKYDCSTLIRRFESWNKASVTAGLEISNKIQISDERLFENLLALWQHFGRQPRRRDLMHETSVFSQSPYLRRFGSWTNALESFVKYANDSDSIPPRSEEMAGVPSVRKTPGEPSLRLRFKVLMRDNFTCRQCGGSPAKTLGVELHVDHIKPSSLGGETTLDNLQTLCSKCNLGKSNFVRA